MTTRIWKQQNQPTQPFGSGSTIPTGGSSEPEGYGMTTTIVVVDGADGLTPDMLRVRDERTEKD